MYARERRDTLSRLRSGSRSHGSLEPTPGDVDAPSTIAGVVVMLLRVLILVGSSTHQSRYLSSLAGGRVPAFLLVEPPRDPWPARVVVSFLRNGLVPCDSP